MLHTKFKRSLALVLTLCMVFTMMPLYGIASEYVPGDQVTTNSKEPPASIPGAVWVLTDSVECKKIAHTHEETCYYQSCDHKDGHLSTCYSENTEYTLCEHEDETQHTGSVTLTDVVEISGTSVSWKTGHPAYSAVYTVYKQAYDEAYASAKWFKETAAKAAGVAALVGKTFCYTTNASAEPTLCTHGACSDYTGACFSKLCILEGHEHNADCYQYTWTLKTDMNNNGVADDADTYYTIKYVSDGETVYEKAVLVGMPTPTVDAPTKAADKQYTYEFAGWDIPVADAVTEDVTYTAVYTNIVNKYTVTWVDEDGTELEVDRNVEYGEMPTYNSELPVKTGDNTVVYTFAGWTPDVDTVTGDVTYTATYTSQSVFAVKFFIDGALQKTEYVVDGETVKAYQPTREHYALTPWQNESDVYDFDNAVTSDMELHASWKLAECVVTVKAPNAEYTESGAGVYEVGETVVITVTPKDGYAVTKILVNGTSMDVTYNECAATVTITTDESTEQYLVEAKTQKVIMELQSAEMNVFGDLSSAGVFNAVYVQDVSYPVLKASDVKVEYLACSIEIFDKTYEWWVEPGTDVSLEKFLEQYGLGALASYIPTESLPHAFGAQSTEQVRVTFAGNEKFGAMSATATVALVDLRIASEVVLNEGVSVTYGASADDILKLVFKSVNAGKTVITDKCQDVAIKMDSLNAGTRKATVSFAGNDEYAASVAEVEVVIKKAAGELVIESYTGKFGTDVNASELFSSNGNRIEMAMGLFLENDVSADAGTVITVNLPALMDLNTITDPTLRHFAEQILDGINDKLTGTMTVEELKDTLEKALPYVEAIEDAGYEINLNSNTVSMLIAALNEMSQLDGVGSVYLNVSIDKDIILKDAGAYILAGITADSNYTTALNVGYAVVTPDGYRAELGWNVEDENGIITLEALRNGYDLGASAIAVHEGNIKDATAHVRTVFFGVNKAGEVVLTEEEATLDIGAYTQVAFIADLGNTMYYAEPIMRAFIVAADVVNVQFIDGNGNVNPDRIFKYGVDASMKAQAFDRNGNLVTNGAMSYLYMGVQLNGEFYRDTKAPTRPGVYTVIAVFIGEDTMTVGATAGALVIQQIDPVFTVEDTTVQYDGKEHNITVKDSTGMYRVYIIMDENGTINVIMPAEMNDSFTVIGGSLTELLTKLETLGLPNLNELPEIPEDLFNDYQDVMDTITGTINGLKEKYPIQSVKMNAALPSAKGVYQYTVIGFKDVEHKVVVQEATLTIMCDHAYDNACDPDCNLCGEPREISKHKETYVDRYESTCVKQGYEKIRCKACHEVLSETTLPLSEEHAYYNGVCLLCQAKERCEHNYEVVKELAPTCVEAGYVWTVCTECGAEKNYEVGEPTGAHGDTYIDRFESTCVKQGYEKTRCKVCHEIMSETTLPLAEEHVYHNGACLLCGAKEHREHNYVVVKELAPTCVEAGYVWMKCSECGAEKNHEVGEPTGKHGDTYIDKYESTCVKHGYERTRCKVCHAILSEVELPLSTEHAYYKGVCLLCGATESCTHDYVTVKELAPTCGEAGYVWTTCSKCGEDKNYEVGQPTGNHTFDNACDTTCNGCPETRQVGDHQYVGAETKSPECGAAGEKTYVCTECGDSYTEDVPATGDHTYDNKCDATCNNCDNVREVEDHIYDNACDITCNECGAEREVEDHKYTSEEIAAPSCNDEGMKRYTCSECGNSYNEAIPATGEHVYDNACDADCNNCQTVREVADHVYDNACDVDCNVCEAERIVEDHKYVSEETMAPTCGVAGKMSYTCSECGDNYTEEIPATGEHVYDNNCDAQCNECSSERTPAEHQYVSEQTIAPSCGTEGEMTHVCTECGDTYTTSIPATENHTYDNVCDKTCNDCDATREVDAHEYDNDCDTTCNICGDERDVGAHVYDNACDTKCNVCDDTREVEAHPYVGVEAKAPTCGAAGEMVYTCPECNDVYTEAVDATGEHTYDNACDDVCNGCGAERDVEAHPYVSEEVKKPTCGTAGEMNYECPICGQAFNVDIPATGEHVYDNACDAACNVCQLERKPADHVYADEYDATCDVCGDVRDVPDVPTQPSEPDEGVTEEIPKTEDVSYFGLWMILMVCSAALLCILSKHKYIVYTGKYSK